MKGLISHDCWDKLFSIDYPSYRQLTLEVLSTFEARQDERTVGAIRPGAIRFQAFGKSCEMNYIEFAIYLGIYDDEFSTRYHLAAYN